MIVVDSSAVITMLHRKPRAEEFAILCVSASSLIMSPVNHLETLTVLMGRGRGLKIGAFKEMLREFGVPLGPVDNKVAYFAEEGLRRFGKGRHPAGLDLGDCFAYGTARALNAPLLFAGDDFARTDVRVATAA